MKTLTSALLVITSWIACSYAIPASADQDILTTAAANGNFDTLVSLVTAADLDSALESDSHFTVFAPTDEAFAQLPADVLTDLRKPENRDRLASILSYHVIGQEISVPEKAPAHPLRKAKTLNGEQVNFSRQESEVRVNESLIVTRNIRCSNGLIHVIDAVLLPPEPANTIPVVANSARNFTTLLAAVKAAGLSETLASDGPFTVFAPNDDAFAKLPEDAIADLLKEENRERLTTILKYHVISGRVTAQQAAAVGTAETLANEPVTISISNGQLRINDARVINNDINADNGIIHVIDSVLMPGLPQNDHANAATSQAQDVVTIRGGWDDRIVRDGIVADTIDIRIGGGGTVRLTNVKARLIKTSVGGGSSVTLSGMVEEHEARVGGGASLSASELVSHSTTLTVAGGGEAFVNATSLLEVGANGGANVRYVDNDAEIRKRINKYATFKAVDISQ